jgi:AcrR family transcriptional regulator
MAAHAHASSNGTALDTLTGSKRASASERQGAHVEEMQRRRILLAICAVVGEKGLHEASVGVVCKRAGVSRRTFYEIFVDREACLLAAFEDTLQRLAGAIAPVYAAEGRWSNRVRGALTLLLERFDAEPGLARLCVVETLRAGPELLEGRARVLAALALAVDEGREQARRGSVPPPLTAQGVVGGALSVIHARLLDDPNGPLVELAGPLTAMIVFPYLGPAAAEGELVKPAAPRAAMDRAVSGDPFKDLRIRFTYRTARVLAVIAATPGASNRHVADSAGIADEGQASRLLRRLADAALIENGSEGRPKGEPNAWTLTARGEAVHLALSPR